MEVDEEQPIAFGRPSVQSHIVTNGSPDIVRSAGALGGVQNRAWVR
jgi:hypothetical protein